MTPSRTRTVDAGRSRRRGRRRRAGPPPLKEPISLGFQFGATVAAAPHSRAGRTRGFVQILRRDHRDQIVSATTTLMLTFAPSRTFLFHGPRRSLIELPS